MFHVAIFWAVTSFVGGYHHVGGPRCLHFQGEDGGSVDLLNVGILPQHYMTSPPRRLRLRIIEVW
jgi:hypothetical protein